MVTDKRGISAFCSNDKWGCVKPRGAVAQAETGMVNAPRAVEWRGGDHDTWIGSQSGGRQLKGRKAAIVWWPNLGSCPDGRRPELQEKDDDRFRQTKHRTGIHCLHRRPARLRGHSESRRCTFPIFNLSGPTCANATCGPRDRKPEVLRSVEVYT